MEKIKAFFAAIKAHLNKSMDKTDFYALLALVITLVAAWKGSAALAGVSLLPAFIAGFYLAIGTEPDDGGDDEDDDEFPDDDLSEFVEDARSKYGLKA